MPFARSEAETATVGSSDQLKQFLSQAQGGETVLLAPGDYDDLELREFSYDRPVVLRAADRDNQPVFRKLVVKDSRHLTFDGLKFFRGKVVSSPKYHAFVDIYPSEHLTFIHCRIEGAIGGEGAPNPGFATGHGFKIRDDVSDLTIQRCFFTTIRKAISAEEVARVQVIENWIYRHREDGIHIGGADLLIADNMIVHNRPFLLPRGKGDHTDAMALHGIRQTTIRNNFIYGNCQGIFGNGVDKNWGGDAVPGELTVTNNIVSVSFRNALYIRDTPNSRFTHNTVLEPLDDDKVPSIIEAPGSSGGTVLAHNLADRVNVRNGVAAENNAVVQNKNPGASDHYNRVLADALPRDDRVSISGFSLKPGVFEDRDPRPGADTDAFFWLNVGDLSSPGHPAHPFWQLLEPAEREALRALMNPSARSDEPS